MDGLLKEYEERAKRAEQMVEVLVKRLDDLETKLKKSGNIGENISSTINPSKKPNTRERTFIMIKPDGVQRGLIGSTLKRFETRGYKLIALKLVQINKKHAEDHYSDLSQKPFFPKLVEYVKSGPVVAMVWEGTNVVKGGRTLIGATNPSDSHVGSVRGGNCIDVGRNLIHGSDSVESAEKEINLWFTVTELKSWNPTQDPWIYE